MKIIKLIIILLVILIPQNLFADDLKAENLELFMGKWSTNCASDNENKCALERSVFIDKEMKKKLITVIMQTELPSKKVRFVLISPLGTLIPSGVKIGFDGEFISDKAYSFNICRIIGCITSMMVKNETLERFKKANDLNLEYVGANGQKININFDLKGFTKELEKIL